MTGRPELKRKNAARPGRPPKRVSDHANPALPSPEDKKQRKAAGRIKDDAFAHEFANRPPPPVRPPRIGSSIVWLGPRLQAFVAAWIEEHPGEPAHRRGVKIGHRISKWELAEALIERYGSGATVGAVVLALRGVESFLTHTIDTWAATDPTPDDDTLRRVRAAAERWRPLLTALKKRPN